MGVENFDQQSYADAFDRNLEGMRIEEIKEALGFMVEPGFAYPIEELSGREVTLAPQENAHLKEIDAWIADIVPRMEADRAKAHEIKPWEFRQFEER